MIAPAARPAGPWPTDGQFQQVHSESTLSTFTASDGNNLALQQWPVPEGLQEIGHAILVHGLGEHAGRYDHVARRLNDWGFAVRGYDHYGHGDSNGPRGGLPAESRLVDDLSDLIERTRARMEPGQPLIVVGHSLGGLVAACTVACAQVPVDGLVLSSPAFDPGLNIAQKLLVAVLPRIAPNFVAGNGVDPRYISRDEAVVAAYRADPRVHDRISARMARFIADAGPTVIAHAPQWSVPTLLMYAGDDRLVNPRGSRAFAAAAPAHVVQSHCFDGYYHELFNEPGNDAVFDLLRAWLQREFELTREPN